MELLKFLNVELFNFEGWDDVDEEVIQYYGVHWNLDSLKQYNNRTITLNRNGDIQIYKEDDITLEKEFNLSDNEDFIKSLLNKNKME